MVQHPAALPMGIAGIYRQGSELDNRFLWTFAMLTVNADGHPVYQRMHKPGDEKRIVTILDPADHDRWLQCTPAEAKSFFKQWHGLLDAFPALPPRRREPRSRCFQGNRQDAGQTVNTQSERALLVTNHYIL
jgi:hypothetical protein